MDQRTVKELFEYEDGRLYWKKSGHGIQKNKPAGSMSKTGYSIVHINFKQYRQHRIIFLMFYGFMPNQIDHIDGNKSNNKIENLRECTHQQNQINKSRTKSNTSGYKNVFLNKRINRWGVRLKSNGKIIYGGHYKTIEEANQKAIHLREKYHGEFAKHD